MPPSTLFLTSLAHDHLSQSCDYSTAMTSLRWSATLRTTMPMMIQLDWGQSRFQTPGRCKVSYAVMHEKHLHMGVLVILSRSLREPKSPSSLAQVPCACHCFSASPSHAPRSFKELSLYPYFSFVLLTPSFALSLFTPMHSCVHGLTLV